MEVDDPVKVLLKTTENGQVVDCRWIYGTITAITSNEPRFKVEFFNDDGKYDNKWFWTEDIHSTVKAKQEG